MVIFSKTLDNRAKKCTGARTSCSVVPKIGLIQRTNNCRQSELIRKKNPCNNKSKNMSLQKAHRESNSFDASIHVVAPIITSTH